MEKKKKKRKKKVPCLLFAQFSPFKWKKNDEIWLVYPFEGEELWISDDAALLTQ